MIEIGPNLKELLGGVVGAIVFLGFLLLTFGSMKDQ